MKKQINPTIKAHLIRSAFYVILLLAVCVIPFALAQRNTNKRGAANPSVVPKTKFAAGTLSSAAVAGRYSGAQRMPASAQSQLPYQVRPNQPASRLSNQATSGPSGVKALRILPPPKFPRVVLYDQYDNDLNNGIVSEIRLDDPTLSAETADNFVVPGGETWTITEVDVRSPVGLSSPALFDVHFYTDSAGFPGTEVYVALGLAVVGNPDYTVILTTPAVLGPGTYWVSVVGTQTGDQWFWEGRSVTSNGFSTAWRNPGNGYGTGCTDWGRLETCIGIPWPDQMFRLVGTTGGGACNLGPWNIVADYPFASESVSVSSDGTFAYAVGGFDPNIGPTNAFNQYDPVANTWTPLPNIPGAFYDAPSVYDPTTNSVYVFGGLDATFTPSDVLQIYNVGTGIWTTGTPMPGARYFASAAYYSGNGKIYVIAGFDSTFFETSTTWEYDPVADTWDTTRANTPIPLGGSGYSIVGQNIYLAGTWNNAAGSTVHYRYDIVADSWTQMADVPVPIYRPDAAAIGTNTYLVGGGNPSLSPRASAKDRKLASMRAPAVSYNSTYIYDTVADSWTTGPNTNVAHSFTGGTAIGTKLIVVTGFDGATGDTNTVEASDCGAGGVTPTPTPTATATPTGTPGGCQFQVLIVYADSEGLPTQLQSEILAEPGVTACDLFDASVGTPTLAQLQQYNIVVPFSNSPFLDGDTLGNNLADYVDGGGIVVQHGFSHYGPGQPYGVNGRWVTGGYNPYDYSVNLEPNAFSLGTFNAGHPLMAGVTSLNSNFANVVTPNGAATEVAQNNLGESLVAFRPVGGHTTVGVTAYVGAAATESGDWGKVVVNAGRWLLPCATPTPTPTATATPTPSATATATPTPTRPPPTPRPRPTPYPRP